MALGVQIGATDKNGYTALHIAAAEGHEGHTSTLLKHGANPNLFGNQGDHQKTPLHRARTQRVVQHLLQYGADPCARMVDSRERYGPYTNPDKDQPRCSALSVFLKRFPTAIEELFLKGITTNGQELDSMDLQLIYNFEIFFKEGFENEINCEDIQDEHLEDVKEMAAYSKILAAKEVHLLQHPLAEAFLHLKWQLVKEYFYLNMMSYTSFLCALTSFVILQTEMFKCQSGWNIHQTECGDFNKKILINGSPDFNFFTAIHQSLGSENEKNWMYAITFYFLGIFSFLGFCFIAGRELWQAMNNFGQYVRSYENIMECALITATGGYFASLIMYPLYSVQFGAWSILLSWLELMLMLGRIPSIGLYVYMSVNVFKTLMKFLMVFSPLLVAFGVSFHILLPSKVSFVNLPVAILKTLAMMSGEFNVKGNFVWEESKEDFGHVTTQAFFLLFFLFVSIVIANLLIGKFEHSK